MPKNDTFGKMEQIIVEISANQREQNQTDFEKYSNDPNYVDVKLDLVTGGLKARHIKHKRNKKGDIKFGLKPFEIEDECQNTIFKIGGSCIFLDEKQKRQNGETAKSLDALINGNLCDIRTVTEENTNVRNCITDKHKQIVQYNKDFGENADAMCLFYYDDSFYTDDRVKKGINDYRRMAVKWIEGIAIRKILVVLRNQKRIIEYCV